MSATQASLTTVDGIHSYLAGTIYASHTIASLSGGLGNYTYRIRLIKPIDGQETLVLKHAQPFIKNTTMAFSLDRQMFEYEAMKRVKAWLPADSLVTVPTIYKFDTEQHVLIMEDCGADVLTLKDIMLQIDTDTYTSLAATIGSSLGHFIGSMHEWSRANPDGILDFFARNKQALELSAWATYGRLIQTLKSGEGDDLPQVADTDLAVIQKVAEDVSASMLAARDCFVMGDFWPGNVMVALDNEKNLTRLYLLDWELAKPGLPGVEIGQLCAEVHLVRRYIPAAENFASAILDSFLQAYADGVKPDIELARHTLAHWGTHLVVWTPRIPTWADNKEKMCSVVEEGVKLIVIAMDGSETLSSLVGPLVRH
ncbi:hypothetical protein J132_10648 [Termitomyces sp. J132]|nr:hypothetical protein H2248_001340 [Termitomyces sp. 'cryptogamus']KNZ76369.1 hypothetical protein J132_10648 [Termitomyces sp. J132]